MSVDKFRFVSPGVFINEIDQSQVPQQRVFRTGPAIIGRTVKGPAMRPITVSSFSEFVDFFGNPSPGGEGGDVWRDGNKSAPTYAAYAAQAYLSNDAPVTIVRLLGDESPQKTAAGSAGWVYPASTNLSPGGAYGLFVFNSQSAAMGSGADNMHITGTLAAVWYLSSSANIALVGVGFDAGGTTTTSSTAAILQPAETAGQKEFKVRISGDGSIGTIVESTFNFNETSGRYIRKVFNTNPQLVNDSITTTANKEYYFLGETFERGVTDLVTYGTDNMFGCIVALSSSAGGNPNNFATGFKMPQTPPIVAQDQNSNYALFNINSTPKELFSIVARDQAEWAQNNLKISLLDIKQSPNPSFEPYGKFSLLVRDMMDTDANPVILEQYNNLSLNPNSPNYIGRRIGDKYVSWDTTNRKYREYGQYDNVSRYIRMNMDVSVDGGNVDPSLLPFGFKGVPKNIGFNFNSGSTTFRDLDLADDSAVGTAFAAAYAKGSGSVCSASAVGAVIVDGPLLSLGSGSQIGATHKFTGSFAFPMLPLRLSSSDGQMIDDTKAYWGMQNTTTATSLIADRSVIDLLRMRPLGTNRTDPTDDDWAERGPGFSLDNVCWDSSTEAAYYNGGLIGAPFWGYRQGAGVYNNGRVLGKSMTAVSASYTETLDQNYNRFTVPMFGGFDGFNIAEKEPFNNERALGGETTAAPNDRALPMLYTAKKGIDTIADPDIVDINLLAVPGMTPRAVTNHALRVAQNRADTLAIIDLEGGYVPQAENTDAFSARAGSTANTITYLKARNLNNSYGACYYPWVQSRDTLLGSSVWLPPSIAALGTYASSTRTSDLWFAPAGFNRGGLSRGAAGVPVVSVLEKLTSKQRDDLYEVNINPIASFPAEGIVVFGQKTLQATPSALDRINVRRLLIYLKKQISIISTTILFDPNIQVTWDRFLASVEPLLKSVKARYGLQEYRVILDSTTTTPELVDRNIMYAKVLLKPTKAIEFIALDFVVTSQGASFDD
jgi:phage tail sheath protein FI